MISNKEVAQQISELMLDIFCRVDESLVTVKAKCSPEEAVAYRKAASGLLGPLIFDVLEPLYQLNPELKPPKWDD